MRRCNVGVYYNLINSIQQCCFTITHRGRSLSGAKQSVALQTDTQAKAHKPTYTDRGGEEVGGGVDEMDSDLQLKGSTRSAIYFKYMYPYGKRHVHTQFYTSAISSKLINLN